jgi:hypothetical protein
MTILLVLLAIVVGYFIVLPMFSVAAEVVKLSFEPDDEDDRNAPP